MFNVHNLLLVDPCKMKITAGYMTSDPWISSSQTGQDFSWERHVNINLLLINDNVDTCKKTTIKDV